MEQGYSPFRIARFFIEKAADSGKPLTPMKLIKLVYIAHGWSLALAKKPLISERIEAWKYGPVIESLYHAFKHRGNSPIPKEDASSLSNEVVDPWTATLLEKVWEKYGGLSGVYLSSLTHQPGTPWQRIWDSGGKDSRCSPIPNEKIQEFYSAKLTTPEGSGH
jgi:uncharacterized phage-associated protein